MNDALEEQAQEAAGDDGADTEFDADELRKRLAAFLSDEEAIARLNQRWLLTEVAKGSDYDVFMATNETAGKDTSGNYLYRTEANGTLVEDEEGNPLVDQDCVSYRDIDPKAIAEQFVAWAQAQGFRWAL